jgi:hypothetical protein
MECASESPTSIGGGANPVRSFAKAQIHSASLTAS